MILMWEGLSCQPLVSPVAMREERHGELIDCCDGCSLQQQTLSQGAQPLLERALRLQPLPLARRLRPAKLWRQARP